MFRSSIRSCFQAVALVALTLGPLAFPAMAQHYLQTNLVADQSGVAPTTDPNLVNPWGMSRNAGSPWWISDNGTGLSTLYTGTGSIVPLVVTIPTGDPTQSPTGTPTGTVFAGGAKFVVAPGKSALFMFVTEDGTISAWYPGIPSNIAAIKVNTKSASVFKGAALATVTDGFGSTSTFLYVADFRKGRVNVYDESFNQVFTTEGQFDDDHLPHGYAPFNVQNIGGEIYVAYARQDSAKHDPVGGPGLGFVDIFSTSGRLLRRLEHGPWLNSPWGLVMASGDFGPFSHDLLVGQFGSGQIAIYNPVTGHFKGLLVDSSNNPITIDSLWSLSFASGGASGSATALYFTGGPGSNSLGLLGTITPVENAAGNSN
ncbi:MAG TPA: TIGR03118 family protein [Terracidiphilus sp.]|nr:TIGR03118 family protein [Terracidiphilus sp.]